MDPRKLKVNELKEQLQLAGLSVNGKKEELVARLLEHQKAEEEATLGAGPPTGTGESFNWEDPIDDLAPPTADAPVAAKPAPAATATTPAAKAPVAKEPTTATTATTAAIPATTKPAEGTAGSVEFQGIVADDAEALKAEVEKRKARAARFGIALTEQDKALERAARFGVPVAASTTASLEKAAGTKVAPVAATKGAAKTSSVPAKSGSIASEIPAEVLSKRQERFGTVAPAAKASTPAKPAVTASAGGAKKAIVALDAEEEEKRRKRAAKFGAPSADENASKKAKV
ncbi:hypothetical protein BGW39_008559 [Mortierella sp. 14UC]|nr:hypothetical protein BGW39_008559 [Mortierella sp. 14UC]